MERKNVVTVKGNAVTLYEEVKMKKYRCIVCGYIYDPADNNNVAFGDLPEDWVCPECGVGKDQFEEL